MIFKYTELKLSSKIKNINNLKLKEPLKYLRTLLLILMDKGKNHILILNFSTISSMYVLRYYVTVANQTHKIQHYYSLI